MDQKTKDDLKSFVGKAKTALNKGFDESKKAIGKAGVAVQDFGDKSVTAFEKKQFESKRKKIYTTLGELVAKKLNAKNASPLSADDQDVAPLLKQITTFNKEISKREKLLKEENKVTTK